MEDSDIKDITSIYPLDIPLLTYDGQPEVLLLELPPRYEPFLPNGLAYVHNILKNAGLAVKVMDANIVMYHKYHSRRLDFTQKNTDTRFTKCGFELPEDPWDNINSHIWNQNDVIEYFDDDFLCITQKIIESPPKILGVSFNGLNRSVIRHVLGMIRKALPNMPVVAGGYDFIYHSSAPREFDIYDYAIIREAPLSLPALVNKLLAGKKPYDMPGIISKFDTPDRKWQDIPFFEDLDSLGFPKYDWYDIKVYSNWRAYLNAPVTTSWGCLWGRCSFCAEKFKWRARSADDVADELEWLNKHNVSDIVFNDSDMNGNPQLLMDICTRIIERNIDVSFGGQLRVDKNNDDTFFSLLRYAGCRFLRFGIDGWSDNVLRLQKKGYNMSLVAENLRLSSMNGINTFVNVVIGVPGETEDDIDECIKNLVKNKGYYDRIDNINILILAAGSHYYNKPDAYGVRFIGCKKDIFQKNPHAIPDNSWYSYPPHIDAKIRQKRLRKVYEACTENEIRFSSVAKSYLKNKLSLEIRQEDQESDFDNKILKALERIRNSGFSSVCLYGQGKHSRKLLEKDVFNSYGLRIAGFIDDSMIKATKIRFKNQFFTSVPMKMSMILDFDCILISSDRYEEEIYKKCAKAGLKHVFRVYG